MIAKEIGRERNEGHQQQECHVHPQEPAVDVAHIMKQDVVAIQKIASTMKLDRVHRKTVLERRDISDQGRGRNRDSPAT